MLAAPITRRFCHRCRMLAMLPAIVRRCCRRMIHRQFRCQHFRCLRCHACCCFAAAAIIERCCAMPLPLRRLRCPPYRPPLMILISPPCDAAAAAFVQAADLYRCRHILRRRHTTVTRHTIRRCAIAMMPASAKDMPLMPRAVTPERRCRHYIPAMPCAERHAMSPPSMPCHYADVTLPPAPPLIAAARLPADP